MATTRAGTIVFAAVAATAAAACGGQVRWGAETAAVETADAKVAPAPPAPKKLTAREYAASFASGRACAADAERQYASDETRGWALLVACVERGDHTDLPALVDGPWRARLVEEPAGHAVLADVVAARGGVVEVDVAASQDRRFPLLSLEEAFEDPEGARGKLVLVRGVAKKKPKRTKTGKLVVDVKELVVDGDAPERGAFESDRGLQLVVDALEDAPKPGTNHVLLVRFEGLVEDALPVEPVEGPLDDPGLAPAPRASTARAVLLAARPSASKR